MKITVSACLALLLGCGPHLNPPAEDPIPPCAADAGLCACVLTNSKSCLCRVPGPADRLCWRPL